MRTRLICSGALIAVASLGVISTSFAVPVLLPTAATELAEDKHEHKEGDPKHKEGEEHHGEKRDLGTNKAGPYSVQVTQVGDVKAGEKAVFVVTLSGNGAKPKAVRGWVGVESGERSIKSKADDEGKEYHLHHQVSKPLAEESKLWIEVETSTGKQKASFELKS